MEQQELLIAYGGEIKALGDGKVGGYLVRFTDADSPDLENDFFTKDTDYDAEDGDRITVYYAHGQDATLGRRKLGKGILTFKDVGVWVETQLKLRDAYEKAIYEMAQSGKLGWSSGTPPHLVEREQIGKAYYVKSWPLGSDASLTPVPAAGPELTQVITFKQWQDANPEMTNLLETGNLKRDQEIPNDPVTDDVVDGGEQAPHVESKEKKEMDENEKVEVEQPKPEKNDDLAALRQEIAALKDLMSKPVNDPGIAAKNVSFNLKTKYGDDETKALEYYIRKGDLGALGVATKASNAVAMQVGTAAEGGNAVPTGHHNNIIARRDEDLIARKFGLMPILGQGTTVNVPLDGEADGEFIETNEEADHDVDSPALGTKALTLLRYTKKIQISWELLEDEASNLLPFLENFVGRGIAKTHNSLLLTEVASNGTALKTFASATVIAVDELEPIVFNDALGAYLDDSGSVGWVMTPAVHGEIVLLDDANTRRYWQNAVPDAAGRPTLLGFPIVYSLKSGATAASTKSVYFGNWNYVGWRDAGMMRFIRDPYSYEGGIELRYQFRTVYGVLQAEAIGYGVHPSA